MWWRDSTPSLFFNSTLVLGMYYANENNNPITRFNYVFPLPNTSHALRHFCFFWLAKIERITSLTSRKLQFLMLNELKTLQKKKSNKGIFNIAHLPQSFSLMITK